jgi:hypothetical protein
VKAKMKLHLKLGQSDIEFDSRMFNKFFSDEKIQCYNLKELLYIKYGLAAQQYTLASKSGVKLTDNAILCDNDIVKLCPIVLGGKVRFFFFNRQLFHLL